MAREPVDATKRLDALQARKLLSRILRGKDSVAFGRHALERMEKHDLTKPDVINTIRCGTVGNGELVNGSWRYRVETGRMGVVVAFLRESEAVVVTAWRTKARGR